VTALADEFRLEKDSLGELPVPAEAYYGINVQRALLNFPISSRKVNPHLIDAYCQIKRAAARVNRAAGRLSEDQAAAIERAVEEILAGKLRDQFVLDLFQAGAGTSTNMNVNEVLCNRALELLGHKKGEYKVLNPNDHVNMSQSTNDTYPTAMRLAAVTELAGFYPEAERLVASFDRLAGKYAIALKSGRTHLQDAVPITLGREFAAYARAIEVGVRHIRRTADDLLDLPIGGSAVGTGMNTHPAYAAQMAAELSRSTGHAFRAAPDLVHVMQSQASTAMVSSALRDFAVELGRIANDLRLLSSGPTTGLAEIRLPEVQAGSSIMPGKVNPSIPEMVNMVCFQVIGNDLTVSQAVAAGQMELNVMMPIMAENVLESIEILTSASRQLALRCVDGIEADEERCRLYAFRSMGLATALAPYIGYLSAAGVAKRALHEGETVPELVRQEKLLSVEELERILDPARMTAPDPDLAKEERPDEVKK
jgi:aspartate ammonia-lyase